MMVVMLKDPLTARRLLKRYSSVIKGVVVMIDADPQTLGGLAKNLKKNGAVFVNTVIMVSQE